MLHTPTPPEARTLTRWRDPGTSAEAAEQVARFAQGHYASILVTLRAQGKAGAERIGGGCGLDAYQVRKRLPELERAGLVRVVAGELCMTTTGRRERVWECAA